MKRDLLLATIIILSMSLCAPAASASPLSIILEAPSDGTETESYSQSFIYSFDEYADILNCSLYIDGEFKTMRNSLIGIQNNKITTEIESGTHEWFIKCYDDAFTEVVSETRTITLEIDEDLTGGFTKISNNDGTITYIVTIVPGQDIIELPAAKGGDDLEIILKGKKYIIDIVKIGTSTTGSFVDVRDRSNAKLYTIYAGSKISLDLDKDETIDMDLQLDEVERSRDAYLTVIPFPGGEPSQEIIPPVTEEPEEEVIPEEETAAEEETIAVEQLPPEEPEAIEEPVTGQPEEETVAPAPQPEPQEEEASMLPLVLVLAIIVVVIIIAIVLVAKNKGFSVKKTEQKKESGEKKEEPAPEKTDEKPAEIIKSIGKKAK